MKEEQETEDQKPSLEEIEAFKKRLKLIWEHIDNVRRAGEKLVEKLCDQGEFDLARRLASRINKHDVSKFEGIEFEYLTFKEGITKDQVVLAHKEHVCKNDHHPNYHFNGVKDMSDEALAECCCDLWARSSEFGSSLWDYVKEEFMPKFNITYQSPEYRKIKRFIDLIIDKQFKKL